MANYGYGPPSWKINYDERFNDKVGDKGYRTNPGVMDKNIFGMAKPGGDVGTFSALLSELVAPSMVDTNVSWGGEIKPTMNNPQDMGMWSRMLYNAASDPVGTAANSLLNTVAGGFTQIPSTLIGAGRSAYEALTSKQDGSKVPVESIPIQDRAQAKGLEGRRLSPYNKIKVPTSRKLDYGSESSGKPKKAESAYSIKQRKKKKEEEEAFQKMMMNYNQRSQNAIPRLGIVPETVWDTWVPDSSTSNYATFDDSGRFDGLDLGTMIFDLDTIGLLDKPTSEAMSSALKSMMKPVPE